ncbi:MAG: DUF5682 family protein [Leptolyngbya sp. Prado105]|jgi:hypothetical protein|nr:DUF5682 family protein [Leptolyngbya sp. Prado105]
MDFDTSILNLDAKVIFFPVRHHSPVCARLIRELATQIRPAAILIEGPADFNHQIDQLYLPHQLPIAIYSYAHFADNTRYAAFYPYCVYSPEWQALQIAKALEIPAKFIDLPWSKMATAKTANHRYHDRGLRQSQYVQLICEKLGIEGLDHLWDHLFEIDPTLSVETYLDRAHQFCFHCRSLDEASLEDQRREAFMAERIRQAMAVYSGQILVVTGGFHSYALYARLAQGSELEDISNEAIVQQGIALTPFSYDRLDSLTGYDAGMPNPGFYHQVWHHRTQGTSIYRAVFTEIVIALRSHRQLVSAADLIAIESAAYALATLRNHAEIWRQDIIDAIVTSLIKEEVTTTHPLLRAVHEVFRGSERGQLAAGSSLPPLVQDIKQQLKQHNLEPHHIGKIVRLNLLEESTRSQILHQLRILQITGFNRTGGIDFASRQEMAIQWEEWSIAWSPAFEGSCIEASIYGSTALEAAEMRLLEIAKKSEHSETAALLLLDACLMGVQSLIRPLYQQLLTLIQSDSHFFTVTRALTHLLYLYCYDEQLKITENADIESLIEVTFSRALWLLESLGQVRDQDQPLLDAVKTLLETTRRCTFVDRAGFVGVLTRTSQDQTQIPILRGATIGALWILDEASTECVLVDLGHVSHPDHLGDFLTGLFSIAREIVQRSSRLLEQIDQMVAQFDEDAFLEALPALRLAFTYFTPREKHILSQSLVEFWNVTAAVPLESSAVPLARAKALESRLKSTIEHYGLRGLY